jgi:hypothetical protein
MRPAKSQARTSLPGGRHDAQDEDRGVDRKLCVWDRRLTTEFSLQYRVTKRLRPIRIGMLSGLTSPESVVRCIEVSTALWGARYNPILPAIESTVGWGETAFRGAMTPADVLARWMRNFDADIFARMEDAASDVQVRPTTTMTGLFRTVTDWRTVLLIRSLIE